MEIWVDEKFDSWRGVRFKYRGYTISLSTVGGHRQELKVFKNPDQDDWDEIYEDEATAAGIVRATLIIDRLNGDNKQIIAHKVIDDDEVW